MKKLITIFIIASLLLIIKTGFATTRSVVPRSDGEGGIGTSAKNWGDSYFDTIWTDEYLKASNVIVSADGTASAPTIQASYIVVGFDTSNLSLIQNDTSANLTFYDAVTGLKTLAELSAAGAGDSVSIDSVAVTDPDFVSTGDIDFVDTSNTVTANINTGKVQDNEIDYTEVTLNDFTNDVGYLTSEIDTLAYVISRGNVADGDINASNVIVDDTASSVVVDTQYIEYSSGGAITLRDALAGIIVNNDTQTKRFLMSPVATQSITATSDTIGSASSVLSLDANADYVMTSTPTITAATAGTIVILHNKGAFDIDLQADSVLPGSTIFNEGIDSILEPNDVMTVMYFDDADGAGNPGWRVQSHPNPTTAAGSAEQLDVRNVSGSTITAFTPVYATGWNAGQVRTTVAPADADDPTKIPAIGITISSIGNNANGQIITFGEMMNVNTSAFSVGDLLYIHTTAGEFTVTRPSVDCVQTIGEVLRDHATQGVFLVTGAGRCNDTDNEIAANNLILTNTASATVVDITRVENSSAQLTFYDTISGNKTLAQLSAGAAGGDAWSDAVDSDILPTGNDNTYDLGSAGASFADIFADGTITGNVTGDLTGEASALTTDSLDALTEIAAALKSGSDATLITGTKGTNTYASVWNADGDLIDGPGVPATVALSNLASVAINTSLLSDADNTDDLGSAAKSWKDIHSDGTASMTVVDVSTGIENSSGDLKTREDILINNVKRVSGRIDKDFAIYDPDSINIMFPIFHVDALAYPNGIELEKLEFAIDTSVSYALGFYEYVNTTGPANQGLIATGTIATPNTFIEITSFANTFLDADDFIFINIPATDITHLEGKIIGYAK